jgi:hypothetical protein
MVHHPEIHPTPDKPSWKEMLAAFISVLGLVGMIIWNQLDKAPNSTGATSNVQVAQEHTGG